MTPEDLKERATAFAVAIVKFTADLRRRPEARNIADQLSASGTAIVANYRSACRARSRREFISKLAVAVEEADETVGWLQIAIQAGLSGEAPQSHLLKEAKELLAILAKSRRTAEENSGTASRRS